MIGVGNLEVWICTLLARECLVNSLDNPRVVHHLFLDCVTEIEWIGNAQPDSDLVQHASDEAGHNKDAECVPGSNLDSLLG